MTIGSGPTILKQTAHSVIEPDHQHVVHALEYTNEADRLAGTNEVYGQTLTSAHLNKLALQTDTKRLYLLAQINPCIIWLNVGSEGRDITTADMDIYVDTAGGNDTTGNGSQSNPFASLTAAIAAIPYKVAHNVTVHHDGNETLSDLSLDFIRVGDGQIVFQSVATATVSAGPFTVDTFTAQAPDNKFGKIDVTGVTWTTDEHQGKHIRVLTGAQAGNIYPIDTNTATSIYTGYEENPMSASDTFEIIESGSVITLTGPATLNFNTAYQTQIPGWGGYGHESFIGFIGFKFVSSDQFHLCGSHCSLFFRFCSFFVHSISLQGNVIFQRPLPDSTKISNTNLRDATSCGVFISSENWWSGIMVDSSRYAVLSGIILKGTVDLYTNNYFTISNSVTLNFWCENSFIVLNTVRATQTYYEAIKLIQSQIKMTKVHWLGTDNSANLIVSKLSKISTDTISGETADIAGHGLYAGYGTEMYIKNTFPSGNSGDIYWQHTGASSSYPTSGNKVEDAKETASVFTE